MAQKARLRQNRYGTVTNTTSSKQELQLGDALVDATERLTAKFGIAFKHEKKVMLTDIVSSLRRSFPTVSFGDPLPNTYMSPDGGFYLSWRRTSDYQGIEFTEFSTNFERTTAVYGTKIAFFEAVRRLDQLHVLSAESVGIILLEEPGKGWVKDGVTILPC